MSKTLATFKSIRELTNAYGALCSFGFNGDPTRITLPSAEVVRDFLVELDVRTGLGVVSEVEGTKITVPTHENSDLPPFPMSVNETDHKGETCLMHRQHEWTQTYVWPTMATCKYCHGPCDSTTYAHGLCEAMARRGLTTFTKQLDVRSGCMCARCSPTSYNFGHRKAA